MHCNERQADISFEAAGRRVDLETVMRGEKMQKEVWSQMEIDWDIYKGLKNEKVQKRVQRIEMNISTKGLKNEKVQKKGAKD